MGKCKRPPGVAGTRCFLSGSYGTEKKPKDLHNGVYARTAAQASCCGRYINTTMCTEDASRYTELGVKCQFDAVMSWTVDTGTRLVGGKTAGAAPAGCQRKKDLKILKFSLSSSPPLGASRHKQH